MSMKHKLLRRLLIETKGLKTRKWYAERSGLSLRSVDHWRQRLDLVNIQTPVCAPEGATHRNKATSHFMRVVDGRVFRQTYPDGWALSTISPDEMFHDGKPLLESLA